MFIKEPKLQKVLDAVTQYLVRDTPNAEIVKMEGQSYGTIPFTWGVSVQVKGYSQSVHYKVSRDAEGNFDVKVG